MRKNIFVMVAAVCATFIMVSCKKDYQKLTMEFIRNLPDTCSLLVQVENEAEHLVYYKGQSTDMFFCYNAETEKSEPIIIPNVDGYDAPVTIIGAGKENIIIGHNATVDNPDDVDLPQAYVQFYNLKTQRFKKFTTCNWYEYDEGTKQLSCFSYDVDRYGDGMRTTDNYDFDGNLMSKKDVEVSNLKEVPAGTLAAKRQAAERQAAERQTISVKIEQSEYICRYCGAKAHSIGPLIHGYCSKVKGPHVPY